MNRKWQLDASMSEPLNQILCEKKNLNFIWKCNWFWMQQLSQLLNIILFCYSSVLNGDNISLSWIEEEYCKTFTMQILALSLITAFSSHLWWHSVMLKLFMAFCQVTMEFFCMLNLEMPNIIWNWMGWLQSFVFLLMLLNF